MKSDSHRWIRRSIRLPGYDYAQAGAYFVTIVTKDRACLFGEIVDGETRLNQLGRAAQKVWNDLPAHYSGIECDAFVIMPNHVHGIVVLSDTVGAGLKPARGVVAGLNPVRAGFKPAPTVRAFKTISARRVNELRETPGVTVWQRNYYEHVVRGENDLNRIREYIANNPLQWALDRKHLNRTETILIDTLESWEV